MSIVDLETLPPDDRAAIQAMVEAAYRKAPELRAKLNDEAPSNAAHWSKVAAEALAEIERLERCCNLNAMRAGKLAQDVERYSALHAALFAQKTNALRRASEAEQDAARFRMLLQQHKHWLGVFRCDPDGAPSDSLDHEELKATLDALIAQEPAPSCHTPEGCRENGCLGWCDEHKPEAAKP